MNLIHPKLADELNSLAESLAAEGSLLSRKKLQGFYDTFRREFGPEVLRSLDGQELLERMHAHGGQDSLVYWLEFKDDAEFPAVFGSIAGGSALKFGVYRRKETGTWAVAGPSGNAPKDIGLAEAIEIARRHRDQLLAACDALSSMRPGADDQAYLELQRQLQSVAPDVQDTAWGHKYLSLIYHEILDDFHVVAYQRYHLIRMLQLPPLWDERRPGRYVSAGRYVALANELQIPLHNFSTLMNRRNGRPRSYWRVGLQQEAEARRTHWPLMRDGDVMAIGWAAAGDLTGRAKKDREVVANALRAAGNMSAADAQSAAGHLLRLVNDVEEGDRVLFSDGSSVLAIAEVAGPYSFEPASALPHQRAITWLSQEEWKAVDADVFRTRLAAVRDMRNHVEVERRILEAPADPRPKPPAGSGGGSIGGRKSGRALEGTSGLVQAVLERKGQVILYGPPGTGKTYWAIRTAHDLAALRAFGNPFDSLSTEDKQRITEGDDATPALVRTCSFHPEYGYEDFIEGYRPLTTDEGQLGFALHTGVFRRLCDDAGKRSDVNFYLIIDEINRGDVPRIFGELLTLLERDKRDHPVILPASGAVLRVPPNVFVIGTMNTADRSIALLDVALRRRFGFVELMPDYKILGKTAIEGLPLGAWLEDLNARIRAVGGGDARNQQIGHAFLLERGGPITTPGQFAAVLRDDVVPLLEEYCYDDFNQLVELLGPTLIDAENQRVRRELLTPDRAADLVAALMRPEITTATSAVMAEDPNDAAADDETHEGEADDGQVVEGAARSV
jgi:5-methylcytosine-specific restriction enzyme B